MQRSISRIFGFISLAIMLAACASAAGSGTSAPTPYPFITATPQSESTLPPQVEQVTPTSAVPETTDGAPPPLIAGTQPDPLSVTETTIPGTGCRHQPVGIFATVYQSDPGLAPSLGCVAGQTSNERPRLWPAAVDFQAFERGYMVWVSGLGWIKGKTVLVLLDDQTYTSYEDTYDPATDPSGSDVSAPSGLFAPTGALAKVWRSQPGLSTRLGFAVAPALHADTQVQMFQYGHMIDMPPASVVIVLKQGQPGSWSLHAQNQ